MSLLLHKVAGLGEKSKQDQDSWTLGIQKRRDENSEMIAERKLSKRP